MVGKEQVLQDAIQYRLGNIVLEKLIWDKLWPVVDSRLGYSLSNEEGPEKEKRDEYWYQESSVVFYRAVAAAAVEALKESEKAYKEQRSRKEWRR